MAKPIHSVRKKEKSGKGFLLFWAKQLAERNFVQEKGKQKRDACKANTDFLRFLSKWRNGGQTEIPTDKKAIPIQPSGCGKPRPGGHTPLGEAGAALRKGGAVDQLQPLVRPARGQEGLAPPGCWAARGQQALRPGHLPISPARITQNIFHNSNLT